MSLFISKYGDSIAKQYNSKFDTVLALCKLNSPFLDGDENLINLSKWCAVEYNLTGCIQKLEDAGHDMAEYAEIHQAKKEKFKKIYPKVDNGYDVAPEPQLKLSE